MRLKILKCEYLCLVNGNRIKNNLGMRLKFGQFLSNDYQGVGIR